MSQQLAGCIRAVVGIAGIVTLECVAIGHGHNGTMLRLALAAVAGLGGFAIGSMVRKRKE